MNLVNLPTRQETNRLLLRPFAAGDWTEYAAYHARPDVYAFLYREAPTGTALREQFDRVLRPRFESDGDVYRLAVTLKDGGAIAGEVMLKLESRDALQAEVGYIFSPAHAGKGYATEAVAAMLAIGFDTLGFHRIFARLDAANLGSVGVVERLGLRREAHLRENDRFNGKWGDEYVYALLRSEWEKRSRPAPPPDPENPLGTLTDWDSDADRT
ncbi:GNAT family N-acetyltransferase [Pleomorphomonas oryzae]|uniref:GNAT family N-acetyltransferase n=1 Tax=Pleomorphomonas oryzae TaxID=261934 RepID=UPI000413634F|nr:GNAT family protein [Pleomorphomonas oryzae]